jgi:hypothetical protein
MGMANWQVKDSELNEMKGIMATHAPLGEDHALRCAGEWLLRVRNGQQAQEPPKCRRCGDPAGGLFDQTLCGPCYNSREKWDVSASRAISHRGDVEEITPVLSVQWDKRPVPAEEEEVRDYWEDVRIAKFDDWWMPPKFHIRIVVPDAYSSSTIPGFSIVRDTEDAAWQAALGHKRAREEKVRQVEREIERVAENEGTAEDWVDWCTNGPYVPDYDVAVHIRDYVTGCRTLARLQETRETLLKGVRRK